MTERYARRQVLTGAVVAAIGTIGAAGRRAEDDGGTTTTPTSTATGTNGPTATPQAGSATPTPAESSDGRPRPPCTAWPSVTYFLRPVQGRKAVDEAVPFHELSPRHQRVVRAMLAEDGVYRRQIPQFDEFPDYVRRNRTVYRLVEGYVGDHCTNHPPPTAYPPATVTATPPDGSPPSGPPLPAVAIAGMLAVTAWLARRWRAADGAS